jgi:hypothetical protein
MLADDCVEKRAHKSVLPSPLTHPVGQFITVARPDAVLQSSINCEGPLAEIALTFSSYAFPSFCGAGAQYVFSTKTINPVRMGAVMPSGISQLMSKNISSVPSNVY